MDCRVPPNNGMEYTSFITPYDDEVVFSELVIGGSIRFIKGPVRTARVIITVNNTIPKIKAMVLP
jgi:hypothetical protein